MVTTWIVYCTECHKEIDRMANGIFAEAVAKDHFTKTKHDVLVGYSVAEDWLSSLKGTIQVPKEG